MDVEAGNNEGSANIADIEAKRFRASRAEQSASNSSSSSPAGIDLKPFGEDGLTFGDIIDVINPLQHIPVISTIYRNLTGDELSPAARIAGGALFGGPIGFVASAANTAVLAFSGKDIGENITAAFSSSDKFRDAETIVDESTTANNIQLASATALRTGQPISLLPGRSTSEVEPTQVSSAAQYLPSHLSRSTQAISSDVNSLPRTAAAAKMLRSVEPAGIQSSIPSSLLAMANASNGSRPDDPIAALLQARAAVPSSGRVPGFGAIVSSRVEAGAGSGATVSPANLLFAQNIGSNAVPSVASSPLAATQAATPKSLTPVHSDNIQTTKPTGYTGVVPGAPLGQPVADYFVPQAMQDALDKYAALKQASPTPSSPF